MIDFNGRMSEDNLWEFARYVLELQQRIGFKVSSRGWCYQLESERIINKDQFDKVEGWINRCRRNGYLPIDFVAEESARQFSGVEEPETLTPVEYFASWINSALNCGDIYDIDWWDGEDYYIQMIVEKIDLKTLFSPVCKKYHIPIATSKGWSSMSQRAEYAKRFAEAEERNLQPILLYCGDHDPDGLRISDFIRSNLYDLKDIQWKDGTRGYDPYGLEINRFGLNYDFIEEHQLTWIDNLITGSGKNLASPRHKNYSQQYVQDYLSEFGERKCEANAIVPMPRIARDYVEDVILSYLGDDIIDRFNEKREIVNNEIINYQNELDIRNTLLDIVNQNFS